MRIYPRKKRSGERVYWASWTEAGVTIRRSTRCSTKPAAEIVVARWERERADPAYAAANSATLGGEAAEFLRDCRRAVEKREVIGGGKSKGSMARGTLTMYEQKIGNLVAVLGKDLALAAIDPALVKSYVDQRLEEGAQESTVYKEWIALRGILKNARHYGRYHREVAGLKPPRFSGQSKAGERFLTWDQAKRVLRELAPNAARLAVVRFVLATGARRAEWWAAQPGDIAGGYVHLRGTKTKKADRTIPIPGVYRGLLEGIGLPFRRWPNARRDLAAACQRASVCETHRTEERHEYGKPSRHRRPVDGCAACAAALVPRVTWNDLRRTFNTLLSHEGVSVEVRAELLGHESTKMAETVYTRTPSANLRAMLEVQMPGDTKAPIALLAIPKRSERHGSRLGHDAKKDAKRAKKQQRRHE